MKIANKIILLITTSLTLAACTTTRTITRVITPPAFLTAPVLTPIKPNPQKATQRDIAVYLIQQNEAISICNAQLQTIKTWGEQWTSSTKQK